MTPPRRHHLRRRPDRLAAYRAHLDIDFPVLADADRTLYRLLGAGRGPLPRVWSPGTLAMYARLLRRGRRAPPTRRRTPASSAPTPSSTADGRLRRLWLPPSPTPARPSPTSSTSMARLEGHDRLTDDQCDRPRDARRVQGLLLLRARSDPEHEVPRRPRPRRRRRPITWGPRHGRRVGVAVGTPTFCGRSGRVARRRNAARATRGFRHVTRSYDLVVIGGGAGGLVAAREARRRRASVLIVQDGPVGGDCTFTGCVPSKTLLPPPPSASASTRPWPGSTVRSSGSPPTEDAAALGPRASMSSTATPTSRHPRRSTSTAHDPFEALRRGDRRPTDRAADPRTARVGAADQRDTVRRDPPPASR